jgi:transcriptional regulator with XRE-family HTH domain
MRAHLLVARNLRRLRVNKGISQENLAVDASIDRTYVSRLERGLENPTVNVLERIAEALTCEITEFFLKPMPGEAAPKALPGGRKNKK